MDVFTHMKLPVYTHKGSIVLNNEGWSYHNTFSGAENLSFTMNIYREIVSSKNQGRHGLYTCKICLKYLLQCVPVTSVIGYRKL